MSPRHILRAALAGTLLFVGGDGASAQRPEPVAALRAIERGQWQLKSSAGAVRKLCLTHPAALLQIAHGDAQCERVVMDNTARSATVRYTCAGHGHGRTTLVVESGKLLSLDTQGVIDGSPFSDQYEGRLLGGC